MPSQSGVEYWQQLSEGADAGVFYISPEVARKLDAGCQTYLAALAECSERIEDLTLKGSMGQFESGRQLEAKFSGLAVGGPRSLEMVLREHVNVIQAMQAFFRRFFADVTDQDAHNATLIGNVENR